MIITQKKERRFRMARAKNGEGSCKLMNDGYWHFNKQLDIIDENTGKNIRIHTTGKTEEEARTKGEQKEKEKRKAIKFDVDGKWTGKETLETLVNEYMMHKIKDCKIRDKWTESTYKTNYDMARATIFKHKIAKLQIHMLNVRVFSEFYNYLDKVTFIKNGKEETGYSYEYKKRIRFLLCQTLQYLIKNGYPNLEHNYAWSADVSKPNQDAIDENTYSYNVEDEEVLRDEDIPKFEQAMIHNKYKASSAFVLMLSTGIRSEELFALQIGKDYQISDDEKSGVLFVYKAVGWRYKDAEHKELGKEPYLKRTKNGEHRLCLLDELSIKAIRTMEQNAKYYCKDNIHNLLFPTEGSGNYYNTDTFAGSFKRVCNQYDIHREVGWGPHVLRHTFITFNTLRFDQMRNPLLVAKAVAAQAGHKDIDMTLNTYTHITPDRLKDAGIINPISHLKELDSKFKEE